MRIRGVGRVVIVAVALAAGALAAVVLADTPVTITGTAGTTYSGPLATFSTSCTCNTPPTIDWGDGTTGTGTDSSTTNPVVSGAHAYAKAGSYKPVVTLTQERVGTTNTVTRALTTAALIQDAHITLTGQPSLQADPGKTFDGTVATFAYDNTLAGEASQFTAAINWGDGAQTPSATITKTSAQHFSISASHVYSGGNQTITVTVTDNAVNHADTTTDDGIRGSTATTTVPIAVGTPLPPPDSTAPHAVIAPVPQPVVAGAQIALSANGSAGADSATWTFCTAATRDGSCPAGSPTQAGTHISHVFTPAALTSDTSKHFRRSPPQTRRSSTWVDLTVTNGVGQSDTTHALFTVTPDLPPKVAFLVSPANGAKGQSDVRFLPQVSDPNANDAITDEDWDLNQDGFPDIICRPLVGCTALNGSHPAALNNVSVAQARAAFATTPKATTLGKAEDQLQVTKSSYAALAVLKNLPGFTWNFAKAALNAHSYGLHPYDLGTLPSDTARATFLRDDGYERFFTSPLEDSNAYPNKVELTAHDTAGQAMTYEVPVALQQDDPPHVNVALVPPDPNNPEYHAGDTIGLDASGIGDTDGSISHVVLEASPEGVHQVGHACQTTVGKNGGGTGKQVAAYNKAHGSHATKLTPDDPSVIAGEELEGKGSDSPPEQLKAPSLTEDQLFAGMPITRDADCDNYGPAVVRDAQTYTKVVDSPSQITGFPVPVASDHWAVSITAYDDQGIPRRRVISNIDVLATSGCAPYTKPPVKIKGVEHGVSGSSVCVTSTGLTSTAEINFDGLHLVPQGGQITITNGAKGGITATSAVDVKVDGSTVAEIPKIQVPALLSNDVTPGVPATATYKGLPIAPDSPTIKLNGDESSDVSFSTLFPSQLGDGATSLPYTVHEANLVSDIVPALHDPSEAERRAKTRQTDSGSGDVAPMELPPTTALGPVKLGNGSKNIEFTYDPPTDIWSVTTNASLPGIPGKATLTIKIHGDSFAGISGHVEGDPGLELAPGVEMKEFGFGVQTDPNFILAADTTLSIADILDLPGSLRFSTSGDGFDLRIDGRALLFGFLPLGSGFVELHNSALSLGGSTDYDFGPASLSTSVSGGIDLENPKVFYVEGAGHACLFVCLKVDAILSNIGVAACGDLDLLLTDISIGIGYRWHGGLSLIGDSCDLSGYKPKEFGGTARAGTLLDLPGQFAKHPGGMPITVAKNQRVLALRVATQAGSNVTPDVQLIPPKNDPRTVASPAGLGDYTFGLSGMPTAKSGSKVDGTTVVDANPLDASTTLIVAHPQPGIWTLKPKADSPPIVSVGSAKALPAPPTPKYAFAAPLKLSSATPVVGAVSGAPKVHLASAAPRTVRAGALPMLERKRLRTITFKTPKSAEGGFALVDSGPGNVSTVLTKPLTGGAASGQVTFDPSVPGTHTITQVELRPDGLPRGSKVIKTYVAPPAVTPPAPGVAGLFRQRGQVYLLLRHAPLDSSASAIAYYLTATASNGMRLGLAVPKSSVRTIKGHPAIALKGMGRATKIRAIVRATYAGKLGPASKLL